MVYDHHSEDGLEAVLRTLYVNAGTVSYTLWPPKEFPSTESWRDEDPLLEEHFRIRLEKCLRYQEPSDYHVPMPDCCF